MNGSLRCTGRNSAQLIKVLDLNAGLRLGTTHALLCPERRRRDSRESLGTWAWN